MSSSLPSPILSTRLRARGESPRHLERGARLGDFIRLRPGAYLPRAEWESLDPKGRHLTAMAAVSETSRRKLLFSEQSAAALHDIPVLGGWSERPHIIDHVGRRRAALVGVVTHRLDIDDEDVVEVAGALATSPLRTAFDIAAARGFLAGVIAFDHVLGKSVGVARSMAEEWLEQARPRRGIRRAEAALAVATGLAESPLESLSLGQLHLLGFPTPRQQVEFSIEGHTYRADFHFEDADVIGEADGRSKYGPNASQAATAENLVLSEKEREDRLRSVVRGFARWRWHHALHGDGLRARLQRAGVQPLH